MNHHCTISHKCTGSKTHLLVDLTVLVFFTMLMSAVSWCRSSTIVIFLRQKKPLRKAPPPFTGWESVEFGYVRRLELDIGLYSDMNSAPPFATAFAHDITELIFSSTEPQNNSVFLHKSPEFKDLLGFLVIWSNWLYVLTVAEADDTFWIRWLYEISELTGKLIDIHSSCSWMYWRGSRAQTSPSQWRVPLDGIN